MSVVQTKGFEDSAVTEAAVTLDTPPTEGNHLIALLKENDDLSVITNPAGFTVAPNCPFVIGSRQLTLVYKEVGPSESSTVTFTTDLANTKHLQVWEVSGLDGTAPDVLTTDQVSGQISRQLGPTGQLPSPDCFVIACAEQSSNNGGSEAVDSGFTLRDEDLYFLWVLADKVTDTDDSLSPTLSWATARFAGGLMAVFSEGSPAVADHYTRVSGAWVPVERLNRDTGAWVSTN